MTNAELDDVILHIIQSTRRPIAIREIERLVAERKIEADTFDVQRSVQRLVDKRQASLTRRLDITTAAS
jgi:hypothetical protein